MNTITCKTANPAVTNGRAAQITKRLRIHGLLVVGTLSGMCLGSAVHAGDTAAKAESVKSRAGYSAGYAFGDRLVDLQRQDPEIELESVFRGILDALSGAGPRLSAGEMDAALQELKNTPGTAAPESGKARQRRSIVRRGGFVDDYAALNAKREGVVTLPSGVQYEIVRPGSGRRPGAGDTVLVNYKGSLTNGAVFDSTYDDGQPARLQLEEIVVPGLREALLLMDQGAKWRLVIPPSMGFRAAGNNMLRRRDLIYDIELVSIETPADVAETIEAPKDAAAQTAGKPGIPSPTPGRPSRRQP